VSVTLTDSDLAPDSDGVDVTVNNVAPVVTAAANQSANEGAATSFNLGSFTDPGADSPWAVTVNWGDASSNTTFNQSATGSLGTASHTYADGPATRTVTVTVTDKDGASHSATFTVTVANVAPVVTAAANQGANEGAGTSFNLGSFTDPGADSPWAVTVDWGDASSNTTFNQSATGSLGTASHTYADGPATRTVTVTVTDKDGASHSATFTVTVANVAPASVSVLATPGVLNENNSATLNGSFTDPGTADTHTVVISWGDGSANTTISLGAGVLAFSGTHLYKDDNPTNTSSDNNTVTVTVTDKDGDSGSGSTTVTVNNIAPAVAITGPSSASIYAVGTPVTFTGTFTDQGTQDTHNFSCTTVGQCTYWQFDTTRVAATNITELNGTGSVSNTYTFNTPGVYLVSLFVRDDDGGVGSATTVNGAFNAMVVIYDPNAGFVTGGGYITHQAAWSPTTTVNGGKDNFGFVAKYKNGASTPDGETEFQCKDCNINFHSTSLDWLIVTTITGGQKAWYQGSGTINGSGDYRFQVTLIDKGSTDYMRIKIWNKTSGAIIYDNQPLAADGSDPVALTQGGNLVIHK
jgi:VCBS repeat-containing protein